MFGFGLGLKGEGKGKKKGERRIPSSCFFRMMAACCSFVRANSVPDCCSCAVSRFFVFFLPLREREGGGILVGGRGYVANAPRERELTGAV